MFQFLQEAITNILNFFQTAWDFIINFFKEIVYIIQLLAATIVNMPSYFTWLPATITVLITTALSIVVIYKILGRDG